MQTLYIIPYFVCMYIKIIEHQPLDNIIFLQGTQKNILSPVFNSK